MSSQPRPRRPGPADVVRTVLALAAILPGLVVGLVVLALGRDRRRAINCTLAVWGDLGTRAAGIRLHVTGREHLEQARPAVFLLNHQSGIDPILVCALLRHDFVAVAKREIRRNLVLGPAFAFAGVVFVDRADSKQAVRALQPALDALSTGLSLAMAPEGTRSRAAALGPFKKGAFRIALAARVPVVPIVIHNARDVLPRGAWIMTSALVRVSVLPPVETHAWTLDHLDTHIQTVRTQYETTLAT
jgi:putative phosphoserine phosphatase/1-acylglycerol-3-phosphate O-acyltransferase